MNWAGHCHFLAPDLDPNPDLARVPWINQEQGEEG